MWFNLCEFILIYLSVLNGISYFLNFYSLLILLCNLEYVFDLSFLYLTIRLKIFSPIGNQ